MRILHSFYLSLHFSILLLTQTQNKMSRIYPTEAKNNTDNNAESSASTSNRPTVWTVWKKSTMSFQGTDGFSIFDSQGKLAFRVDNYSRRHKYLTREILLLDGGGKALLALRPQVCIFRCLVFRQNKFHFVLLQNKLTKDLPV